MKSYLPNIKIQIFHLDQPGYPERLQSSIILGSGENAEAWRYECNLGNLTKEYVLEQVCISLHKELLLKIKSL